MQTQTLFYNPDLLKQWRAKALQQEWYKMYKGIFDEDDLRIALSQPRYHFGEWFVAIHYAEKKYSVLVEKYIYKNHPHKFKIISRYFSPEQISIFRLPQFKLPDLFVYRGEEFFFVEVKRDSDRLGKGQNDYFQKLEKKLNCKVQVVYLKAKSS